MTDAAGGMERPPCRRGQPPAAAEVPESIRDRGTSAGLRGGETRCSLIGALKIASPGNAASSSVVVVANAGVTSVLYIVCPTPPVGSSPEPVQESSTDCVSSPWFVRLPSPLEQLN